MLTISAITHIVGIFLFLHLDLTKVLILNNLEDLWLSLQTLNIELHRLLSSNVE
jgi:hypothetical protein